MLFLHFQEYIIDLQQHMKRMKKEFDYLYQHRQATINAIEDFTHQLESLACTEDQISLYSVLMELAALQQKVKTGLFGFCHKRIFIN